MAGTKNKRKPQKMAFSIKLNNARRMEILMKQTINRITCWYLIFYAIYSLSTRFMPTKIVCAGPLEDILYKGVVIVAGLLALCYIFLLAKTIRPDRQLCLLAVFLVILGISTILNRNYEFVGNVMGMATFVVQLILFYFLPYMMPDEMISVWLKRMTACLSFFWSIACVSSLSQYIGNIHYLTLHPDGRLVRQGIVDGRLFGMFSDPNFAAFTSLLLIILLLREWKRGDKWFRVYIAVCIAASLAYLIMSNSRTIYLSAIGTLVFYIALITYRQYCQSGGKNRRFYLCRLVKRTAVSLAAAVVVYAAVFFSIQGIGYLAAPDRSTDDMVREDVNVENLTNNRSTIWKNYLTLYKDKPIFGFSIGSALPYVTEKDPDSYLAQTQYVTHNSYLSLLIETGITGFLVMAAFFLLTISESLKRIRQKHNITDSYLMFASIIAAVLTFMLCFHDIFFTVNLETMLLFTSIGYIRYANQH